MDITERRRYRTKVNFKRTKMKVKCDKRCLQKQKFLKQQSEAKYGVVKYHYGAKGNLHTFDGEKLTQHHDIPQACGGGNEPENLTYYTRSVHDLVEKIIDAGPCRKLWQEKQRIKEILDADEVRTKLTSKQIKELSRPI